MSCSPTPANPRVQLPGYSSYGQAWGNWRTSIFQTVGYKQAAASMGEHRTHGDLTDSPIRCLALDPWGAYLAISNDRVLYRVAADGSRHDILTPDWCWTCSATRLSNNIPNNSARPWAVNGCKAGSAKVRS